MSENKLSPMMQQYQATKEQYRDCILFYRLGDFYEMFYEDAVVASKVLDIALTGRDCGQEERAPMCGIPYHAYESYAQKLIEKGYKVAICEQTDKIVNKVMQREIVRIITPGTVVDSIMLDESSNNYIMSIYCSPKYMAYAYSDLSTGEMNVQAYSIDANFINDQIIRICPQEIICNEGFSHIQNNVNCITNHNYKANIYHDWAFKYSNAEKLVKEQYNLSSLKGFDFEQSECVIAVGALLDYFKETQKRDLKHLKMPRVIKNNQYMYVDTNTRRNLEIEVAMHNKTKQGSLLWVLDKTLTNGGARMLKSWVRQPLQDKEQINARLNMVDVLLMNNTAREQLKDHLFNIQDIERLVGKLAYGSINPKECVALSASLKRVPCVKEIIEALNNAEFAKLSKELLDVHALADLIDNTIDEKAPANTKEGGYIRMGFNKSLDDLRNINKITHDRILEIQAREREATGIKTLKVAYNRVFGYYIEVSKQFTEQVPFNYIRKQTIANNERYITEELKQIEEDLFSSTDRVLELEEQIFHALKQQLMQYTREMQTIASAISMIDCIYSLAIVASENNYVRPKITNNKTIEISLGRHPIIEKINNHDFIANDTLLNSDDQRTIILTGPNMAGKSTYMRQIALITYMAHIGSFVPAEEATISLVDRIFTRIGASDDLSVGQSTFMVEMIEVANILHFATNNSLIILDEVGRGTSTFDGLSIAWAVVEYLSQHLTCKTLFATHYHELMQLENLLEGVKNYCISIKEIGGKLVFLRKIMRGSATRSYGVEVANLAGLPDQIITRAKELIHEFEDNKNHSNLVTADNEINNILKEIDINRMSPISAFETLSHLVELAKR